MASGDIGASFRATWRKYVIDGAPGSGAHNPRKDDIFATGAVVDARIDEVASTVSAVTTGLNRLEAVRVATTADGTLATAFDNASTIDGVVLATNDRILIKDQAAPAVNGVYVVQASGAPVRATDADAAAELVLATVFVRDGTANANKTFTQTTPATIVVGTTALVWYQTGEGVEQLVTSVGGQIGATLPVDAGLAFRAEETDGSYSEVKPVEPETVDDFADWEIEIVNQWAMDERERFLAYVPTGFSPYGLGYNMMLGVGQSFMAGAVTAHKILLTTTALASVVYQALMIGDSDRPYGTSTTWDVIGTTVFNPLRSSVVLDGRTTEYSSADIAAGNVSTSARGETPIVWAALISELLYNETAQVDTDTTRQWVAMNAAKTDALLVDIAKPSTSFTRTVAGADVLKARVTAQDAPAAAALNWRLGAVIENHGQADAAAGTTLATYKTDHKEDLRDAIHTDIQVAKFGKRYRAPWISEQVSGPYVDDGVIAQAQLEMALDTTTHWDYFMSGPAYHDPHWWEIIAPHPWAGNRHRPANGQGRGGLQQGIALYFVQTLKRNWIPAHIDTSHPPVYRNRTILVPLVGMKPPFVADDDVHGMVLTLLADWGFTIKQTGGWTVTVESIAFAHDCVVKIVCTEPLVAPTVGVAQTGKFICNVRDSFSWAVLDEFKYDFINGYTDTNLDTGGYDDAADLENIAGKDGTQDVANRLAVQVITAVSADTVLKAGVPA